MSDKERRSKKLQLERQLRLCRELMEEFQVGVTADNLRELEVELQRRLADL